jgi:hypothetical protein
MYLLCTVVVETLDPIIMFVRLKRSTIDNISIFISTFDVKNIKEERFHQGINAIIQLMFDIVVGCARISLVDMRSLMSCLKDIRRNN